MTEVSIDKQLTEELKRFLIRIGASAGTFHYFDPVENCLRLLAEHGLPAQISAKIKVLPPEKGLAGHSFKTKTTLYVSHIQEDERLVPQARTLPYAWSCAYYGRDVHNRETIIGVGFQTEPIDKLTRRCPSGVLMGLPGRLLRWTLRRK